MSLCCWNIHFSSSASRQASPLFSPGHTGVVLDEDRFGQESPGQVLEATSLEQGRVSDGPLPHAGSLS